jgi:hypothetical protein
MDPGSAPLRGLSGMTARVVFRSVGARAAGLSPLRSQPRGMQDH